MNISCLLLLFASFIVTAEGWSTTKATLWGNVVPLPTSASTVTSSKLNLSQQRKYITGSSRSGNILFMAAGDNDDNNDKKGGSVLDFIFNPYESKIPEELKDEIYKAEGNTEAAANRTKRITAYAVVAFGGILCAFFNGFLTELRTSSTVGTYDSGLDILETTGFGWTNSNFIFQFLFLNKIGGGLSLLTGAACGLLAEAEYDTRRINAEKIYQELQRRKDIKEKQGKKGSSRSDNRKKKRRSGKEKKRLEALSEVVLETDKQQQGTTMNPVVEDEELKETTATTAKVKEEEKSGGGGVLGSLKDFYKQADNMAETQARLLNKKLEDEGILEKITDESGLKVVGREKAAAKKEKDGQDSEGGKSKK